MSKLELKKRWVSLLGTRHLLVSLFFRTVSIWTLCKIPCDFKQIETCKSGIPFYKKFSSEAQSCLFGYNSVRSWTFCVQNYLGPAQLEEESWHTNLRALFPKPSTQYTVKLSSALIITVVTAGRQILPELCCCRFTPETRRGWMRYCCVLCSVCWPGKRKG